MFLISRGIRVNSVLWTEIFPLVHPMDSGFNSRERMLTQNTGVILLNHTGQSNTVGYSEGMSIGK